MADHYSAADLQALAADPRTDWDVLHWIAENYAELRPAVAANPGAYQELVDALGQLGDPAIDAAIATRHRGRDVSSAAAATNPLAGMYDTLTQGIPVYRTEEDPEVYEDLTYGDEPQHSPVPPAGATPHRAAPAADSAETPASVGPGDATADSARSAETPASAAPAAATQAFAAGSSAGETSPAAASTSAESPTSPVSPTHNSAQEHGGEESQDPADAHSPADPYGTADPNEPAVPFGAAAPYGAAVSHGREPEQDTERRRGAPVLLMAGLGVVVLVAVGAVIALALGLLGDDDSEPVAEPAPVDTDDEAPGEEPADDPTDAEEPPADEGSPSPEDLEPARAEVAALPGESSCEVGQDAQVITAFLTAGTAYDGFPNDEDTDTLEDGFTGLQSSCSATHAAAVFEASRSGDQAGDDANGETLTALGTGWVDRQIGLGGAEEMDGFSMHDGNIQCEFGDGVRCTVFDATHSAPSGCEDATTYRMQVDGGPGEPDCDNPVEEQDRPSLGSNELATDGFIACINVSNRVSCYNSLDGTGFELSEIGHYGTTS